MQAEITGISLSSVAAGVDPTNAVHLNFAAGVESAVCTTHWAGNSEPLEVRHCLCLVFLLTIVAKTLPFLADFQALRYPAADKWLEIHLGTRCTGTHAFQRLSFVFVSLPFSAFP